MKRTLTSWAIFAGALFLVFVVMLFFTVQVLDYETAWARVEQRAALEENVRLALWRMDSAAATLLAQRKVASVPVPPPKVAPKAEPETSTLKVLPKQQTSSRGGSYRADQPQQRAQISNQALLSQQEYDYRTSLSSTAAPADDWQKFTPELLALITDIFPDAALVPAEHPVPPGVSNTRYLASIPARLVIKGDALPPVTLPWNTPVRISLIVAWASAAAAALAVSLLLKGVLDLSERRAAFVSTVTHELRTPLTTFRMYSEMLADGMVPTTEARQHYLKTLVAEADRLGHLIENVLAYARLERHLSPKEARILTVAQLLDRSVPALERRTQQGGYHLLASVTPEVAALHCQVDTIAVHQILLNLVDNACKYAKTDIRLIASRVGGHLHLAVSDTGPGIDLAQSARLFTPFSKSRDDAVPGIGLGLHLSRRLARQLGGDLTLSAGGGKPSSGASFIFSIPLTQAPASSPENT